MTPESPQPTKGRPLKSRDLLTEADELFAALDGQIVSSGNLRWEVRIWGIHIDAGRLWLQIGLLGSRSFAGTIAVTPGSATAAWRNVISWEQLPTRAELFCPSMVV